MQYILLVWKNYKLLVSSIKKLKFKMLELLISFHVYLYISTHQSTKIMTSRFSRQEDSFVNRRKDYSERPSYMSNSSKQSGTSYSKPYQKNNKGYNNGYKSRSKQYINTADYDQIIKSLISSYLNDKNQDSLISNFTLEIQKSEKKQKAALLEKAVSYHAWEMLDSPFIKSELTSITEGDGHKITHWLPWPSYLSKSGMIEGFSRSDEDIIKVFEILSETGCNPLDTNKFGENAFQSLDGAVIFYKNGHTSTKGVRYDPGELGIHESKKELYLQGFLEIPKTDISARAIIKEVLNKISMGNIEEFRNKFCFVFSANPVTVVRELIKSFYKLSVHKGIGEWVYIKDSCAVVRELIRRGPNLSIESEIAVSQYVSSTWNTHEQETIFGELLASHSKIMAEDLKDNETYCSWSLGAIIGESRIKNFQISFISESFKNRSFDQALYCIAHMENPFIPEVMTLIIENIEIFDTGAKTVFPKLLAIRNNWTFVVDYKYGSSESSETFCPDIRETHMVEYFSSLLNPSNTTFDPEPLIDSIRVDLKNILKFKPSVEKLEGPNTGKSHATLPPITINITRAGINIYSDTTREISIVDANNRAINTVNSQISEIIERFSENFNKTRNRIKNSNQQYRSGKTTDSNITEIHDDFKTVTKKSKKSSTKTKAVPVANSKVLVEKHKSPQKNSLKFIGLNNFDDSEDEEEEEEEMLSDKDVSQGIKTDSKINHLNSSDQLMESGEIDQFDQFDEFREFENPYDDETTSHFSEILNFLPRIEEEMKKSDETASEFISSYVLKEIDEVVSHTKIQVRHLACEYIIVSAIRKLKAVGIDINAKSLAYLIDKSFQKSEITTAHMNVMTIKSDLIENLDLSPVIFSSITNKIHEII